jgi:hypothetical protein
MPATLALELSNVETSLPYVTIVNPVEYTTAWIRRPLPEGLMDALAEQLDAKLHEWQPETADQVRQRIAEIIEMADHNALDVSRSRVVEQEVLDILDAPTTTIR